MKKIGFIAVMAIGLLGTLSCSVKKVPQNATEKEQTLTVTGEIISIENGKDGYMATLVDVNGKESVVTISIVNLNKYGGTYKKHNVGDKITAKGPFWKDSDNKIHITAQELK